LENSSLALIFKTNRINYIQVILPELKSAKNATPVTIIYPIIWAEFNQRQVVLQGYLQNRTILIKEAGKSDVSHPQIRQ
jgi:hypothetical protein